MDFLQLVGTEGAVDSDSLTRPLVNLFEQAGESLVTVTLLLESLIVYIFLLVAIPREH